MEPSQWDNRIFTICSDLVGWVITSVEIDQDIFDATQDVEIRVATDEFMEEVFGADEGIYMVRALIMTATERNYFGRQILAIEGPNVTKNIPAFNWNRMERSKARKISPFAKLAESYLYSI